MQVTVRGTTNSDVIGVGEEARVEWTPRLRGMLREGVIEVVEWHHDEALEVADDPAAKASTEPEPDAPELPESVDVEADSGDDQPVPSAEPPRSGRGYTAAAWRKFLDAQGVGYPEDAGRDDLVALWDGGVR